MGYLALLIPIMALGIPFFAIYISHKQKTQKNKIREMELQKEILELEIEKQNSRVKLLEEENKKLDRDLTLLDK
jgi:cell shape-determining protein MreC